MSEHDINASINRQDLEIILETNKKAIEIENEVAEQNEEIIDTLETIQKNQNEMDEKIDKILKLSEDNSKDLFRIQVLFVTGLLSLVIQIIQIFLKK